MRPRRQVVDIARMIDHDAAAELWDRYNRGERNVYAQAHCVHWLVG
jgi:hypothetical protein